jgi:phosphopantetheinyl transferase
MNSRETIEVYCLNLKPCPPGQFLQILPELNAGDRQRAAAFAKNDDRRRFLGGRYLLDQYLKESRASESLRHITLDTFKRPRLAQTTFSISHSEDWVVMAAGTGDISIGIDLEVCVPRYIPDFLAPFTEEETAYILQENALTRFYHAWTKKESALKAIGKGFLYDALEINTQSNLFFYENKKFNWHALHLADDVATNLCHDLENATVTWKMASH